MTSGPRPKGFKKVPRKKALAALAYQPYEQEFFERFAKEKRTTVEYAQHIFEQVKMFLITAAVSGKSCAPSRKQDIMWHHFVLHMIFYEDFEKLVGTRIYHVPTEPSLRYSKVISNDKLLQLARELFGDKIDPAVWPKVRGMKGVFAETQPVY